MHIVKNCQLSCAFVFFFKRTGLTRSLKNVAKQMQRVFKLVTAESHGELKESDHLVLQRHLEWIGNTGISGIVEMEEHPPKHVCEIAFLGEKCKLFDFWQNEILVKLLRFLILYVSQSLLRVDSHFFCEDHGTPSPVQSRTLWHWTHRKQTSKSWLPKQMDCTTGGHEYWASQGLWKSIDMSNPVSGSMIKLLEELC